MKFQKLAVVAIFVCLCIEPSFAQKKKQVQPEAPAPPPVVLHDGALIQISHGSDDPQSALMGLTLALRLSEDKNVLVFFDNQGVEVVLNKAASLEFKKFEPSKILLDKLVKKGVKLIVCPTCLEVVNKTQYDLEKGVMIAQKDDFFNFTNGRIVSFTF